MQKSCKAKLKKALFLSALGLGLSCAGLAQAATVLYCPESSAITITKQSDDRPWGQGYDYSATIPATLPLYGNQLELAGEGGDNKLGSMLYATWTDNTFLCWYQGEHDGDQVVASQQNLDHYYCHFPGSTTGDCTSSNPKDCPLECSLRHSGK